MHGRKTVLVVSSVPLFSTQHFFQKMSAALLCAWSFILNIYSFLFIPSSAKATFDAISKTYSYLTPDLWKETVFTKSPYQVQYTEQT